MAQAIGVARFDLIGASFGAPLAVRWAARRHSFAEHVVAKRHAPTRWSQRILRRPWAWVFEGCSCERDLASVIEAAGFASVDLSHYRIHSPFLPFNTQIAGTATT